MDAGPASIERRALSLREAPAGAERLVRLWGALQQPVDAASLSVFRVVLGALVVVSAARFFANGWIDRFFVRPSTFLHYPGLAWVEPPPWGMEAHFAVLIVLGVMVGAGCFYRVAAPLLFVAFTWVEVLDVSLYLNHYYLLSLLLLLAAVMPLGRHHSVDAWWRGRREEGAEAPTHPAWCVHALRFQLAVVYFYAGLAKLGSDWLIHGQPLDIWLSARSDMPLLGPLFAHHATAVAMSWGGFLYDLTIWAFLLWPRTRGPAFVVLVGFHAMVGLLLPIGMFPFIMTASALVFFAPDWPRRLGGRWRGRTVPARGATEPPEAAPPTTWQKGALGAAAAFAALQILLPLRHFAYPGDVLWTEEGMRWSWKVVVREKNGAVVFRVRLPDGRLRIVPPSRYLVDHQEREMGTQPDLILQLAHRIAEDFRDRGEGDVEVHADAWASLNGRPRARLIDPSVDLAAVDDGLAPKSWILPAPEGPPPHLRAPR